MRVLDVGCGPGRHAHALAERAIDVVGVDISPRFVELAAEGAPANATFVVGDARRLPYDAEFDAVISLCQGGFGLVRGDDSTRPRRDGAGRAARRAARADGLLRLLRVRFLEDTDVFDAATGVNVEQTTLKDETGDEIPFELDTTCFTPRELRLLCAASRGRRRPPLVHEPRRRTPPTPPTSTTRSSSSSGGAAARRPDQPRFLSPSGGQKGPRSPIAATRRRHGTGRPWPPTARTGSLVGWRAGTLPPAMSGKQRLPTNTCQTSTEAPPADDEPSRRKRSTSTTRSRRTTSAACASRTPSPAPSSSSTTATS